MAAEKLHTKHPDGKRNQPIDKKDYELFEAAIVTALRRGELTHTELVDELKQRLKGTFAGNVGWCAMTVKLDLEARKVIERTSSRPQKYRLRERHRRGYIARSTNTPQPK
jgi:hypothetical protein